MRTCLGRGGTVMGRGLRGPQAAEWTARGYQAAVGRGGTGRVSSDFQWSGFGHHWVAGDALH